jgi:diguanylate cyclase (GGDEF)-like protein
MGLFRSKSNLVFGMPAIALVYLAAAIIWIAVSPRIISEGYRAVQAAGALAICAMAAHHLLLRRIAPEKAPSPKNGGEEGPDARIREFLYDLPSNIAIISTEGRFKYWSKAFGTNIMPSLNENEIREMQLFADEYVALQTDGHPFSHEERPLVQALKNGKNVTGVKAGIPAGSNQWTWVELTIMPRKTSGGDVIELICLYDLISGAHTAETDLAVHSFQDSLTGLPNRTLFTELLSRAVIRSTKRNNRVGVMFLDLNRFRLINDTLGHKTGDMLLIQVAKRLKAAAKNVDMLARLGGDEFALFFEDLAELSEAVLVSDWIKDTFEEPFFVEGEECYAGCSIGLAVSAGPGATPEGLIRDAEVAMYRAKSKGTDALEIYDQSMNEQTKGRIKLETEMRRALHRQEMLLHYQPLVNLRTGKISGWESLVRWEHPERGMVYPKEFIGIAEETGLIIPIGEWILNEACRQAQEWRTKFPNYSESIMNVNLSIRQFQKDGLADKIIAALELQQLEPKYLKLEITESHTMKDPASSLAIMKSLKAMQINLAIDDFGTDYSSLSYLKRMPVDTLKIDKSFIDGLGLDPESTAIVQAIISLAKAMDLTVTAEGIETASQLSILRNMGCQIGQGYLFSRPLHPGHAEKLMSLDPEW